jgi:hypothetical protein
MGLFTPKENDRYRLNKHSLTEMAKPQVKLPDNQKIDGADSWALGWAVRDGSSASTNALGSFALDKLFFS